MTAAHDPYFAGMAGPILLRDAPSRHRRLVVVPGDLHGSPLFAEPSIQPTILRFLSDYLQLSTSETGK